MTRRSRSHGLPLVLLVAVVSPTVMGEKGDEPAPSFTALALLASDVRKGPHYTVKEPVKTVGFFHEFAIVAA